MRNKKENRKKNIILTYSVRNFFYGKFNSYFVCLSIQTEYTSIYSFFIIRQPLFHYPHLIVMNFYYQKISFALFYVRIYPLLSVNIFNSMKGNRNRLYSYLSLPVCLSVYIGSFYRLISYQPNLILAYNMSITEFNKK